MNHFRYVIDKIQSANFSNHPFQHVYIEELLEQSDFDEVINSTEIQVKQFDNTENLILELINNKNYYLRKFPGSVQNVEKYLEWIKTGRIDETVLRYQKYLSGYGLTLTLKHATTPIVKELLELFNSTEFNDCLFEKFNISREVSVRIESYLQKYLSGYELSPHPDSRVKLLTYMLNLNPMLKEDDDIYTKYLELNDDKKWLYDLWENDKQIEREPFEWSWAKTVFEQRKNNSIVLFVPTDKTLHAVKLNYDHRLYQRTQLYGNIWNMSLNFSDLKRVDLKEYENK
jgi:hypothetical protein